LPLFVRINPLRTTLAGCISDLAKAGVTASVFESVPQMLTLNLNGARIPDKVFAQGVCTVQDPSAALVSFALNPQLNETILDVCAAPGGKTTHIAELMRDSGTIKAADINEKRLKLVAEHAQRLGIKSIHTQQLDASKVDIDVKLIFDRVLLDVPCSGSGIFAKKRDALGKKQESDIERLVEIQRTLLNSATRFVRSNGGVLVYSTCSLDFAENEEQAKWFLAKNRNFELVTKHALVPQTFLTEGGFVKALPHRHGCAGAFAAVFRRNK